MPKNLTPPPNFVKPQLPVDAVKVPVGPEWIYELKYDGYRALTRLDNNRTPQILTRNENDWTASFKAVAHELTGLQVRNVMLDGEIVVLRDDDTSTASDVPSIMGKQDQSRLRYYVFDLLHVDGQSTLQWPLEKRKERLRKIIPENLAHIQYVGDRTDAPADIMRNIWLLRAEGIVAKRLDAPYRSGRSDSWRRIKILNDEEMVVGGVLGSKNFGGLLVGYFEQRDFKFAGRVVNGFTDKTIKAALTKIIPLTTLDNPFKNLPGRYRNVIWAKPELVVRVRFQGWTTHDLMRFPRFLDIREDKRPAEVTREQRAPTPLNIG